MRAFVADDVIVERLRQVRPRRQFSHQSALVIDGREAHPQAFARGF